MLTRVPGRGIMEHEIFCACCRRYFGSSNKARFAKRQYNKRFRRAVRKEIRDYDYKER